MSVKEARVDELAIGCSIADPELARSVDQVVGSALTSTTSIYFNGKIYEQARVEGRDTLLLNTRVVHSPGLIAPYRGKSLICPLGALGSSGSGGRLIVAYE